VTVAEASELPGINKDAVRMRVRRGTLRSEKAEGRMHVWVDTDLGADQNAVRPDVSYELAEELRDRVRFLEEQLESEREARTEERRRHDTLMAQLIQRRPELEAPQEASGVPEAAAEGAEPRRPDAGEAQATTQRQQAQRPSEGAEHDASTLREWTGDVEDRPRPDAPGAQEGEQRPWWRRMFGS